MDDSEPLSPLENTEEDGVCTEDKLAMGKSPEDPVCLLGGLGSLGSGKPRALPT